MELHEYSIVITDKVEGTKYKFTGDESSLYSMLNRTIFWNFPEETYDKFISQNWFDEDEEVIAKKVNESVLDERYAITEIWIDEDLIIIANENPKGKE